MQQKNIWPALSNTGRQWQLRPVDETLCAGLAQRHNLPPVIARCLLGRGVTESHLTTYLNPRLKTSLPDPLSLRDMDKASERLARAITTREPIGIIGDYDVDGATSVALLIRYFKSCGITPLVTIPDRITDGYGPSAAMMHSFADKGVRLVITVDCGTAAFTALQEAATLGLEVVVIDHHLPHASLPPNIAMVNPNRLDDPTPHKMLAACGVTYLLLIALQRLLQQQGFFALRPPPDLLALLDLVALGTVADVAPLVGLNRVLVRQGLSVAEKAPTSGLAALAKAAGLSRIQTPYHLGFVLAPRLNAGGRIGDATLGYRLLTSDDPVAQERLAAELHSLNDIRRELDSTAVLEARALVAQHYSTLLPDCVVVGSSDWHPGIIGLIAGRLKEELQRTVIALSLNAGIAKGSARAAGTTHIGNLIMAAMHAGIVTQGGGHAAAAGLTMPSDNIEALRQFLQSQQAQLYTPPQLAVDGMLTIDAVNSAMLERLQALEPFGSGNPEPCFVLKDVVLQRCVVVGENHLRCSLRDKGGRSMNAMAFRAVGSKLGEALLERREQPVWLAGYMRANHWNGNTTVDWIIEDAA